MGRWDRRIEKKLSKELSYAQRNVVDGLSITYASVCVLASPEVEYITVYGYREPRNGSAPDVACNVDPDGTLELIPTEEAKQGPRYVPN